MKLIPKGSNKLVKVGKSIEITNKLITEIDSRKVAVSDDFRVPIPDVNFQRVLEFNYNVMVNKGEVSYGDVKGIDELNCNDQEIKNLQGIEFFNSLTILNCYNNQLSSLDLSKNTALTMLNCYNNQLSSIDISCCPELTELNCYKNRLTSLNVSNNLVLSVLNCRGNMLKELDVKNNSALSKLNCMFNPFETYVDVSKNTLLKKRQGQSKGLKTLRGW